MTGVNARQTKIAKTPGQIKKMSRQLDAIKIKAIGLTQERGAHEFCGHRDVGGKKSVTKEVISTLPAVE